MIKTLRSATLLSSMILTTACGGGSNSAPVTDPITRGEIDAFIADATVAVTPPFSFLSADQTIAIGSATYTGHASIVPRDTFNNIIGRAEIEADFSNGGSLSGQITDLVQFAESEQEPGINPATGTPILVAPLVPITGTLALSNGNVQELAPTSEIDVDIDGTFTIPGRTSSSQTDENFALSGAVTAGINTNQDFVGVGLVDGTGPAAPVTFEILIFATPEN